MERLTGFTLGERYRYDFGPCSYAKGWAQIDTRQDASYYGTWTNPTTREIFTFCEGDTTLIRCADDAEYVEQVRACADWNKSRDYWLGIDADGQMRGRFAALGLDDLLH